MRPITFTEKEVQVIYLALQVAESSWEMFALLGRTKPQPEGNKAAVDGIRAKLAEAAVLPWDGRADSGPEDDCGFRFSGSKRGD